MPHLYVTYCLVMCVVCHVISVCLVLLNKEFGKGKHGAYQFWRVRDLVVHRSSFREIKVLKTTAGFTYMRVTMSNQNNFHEEFQPLVTSE